MTSATPPAASPALERRLGLWSTSLSGVGVILGAGIYVIIGVAAQDAGSAVWLSFVIAALIAGATALSYAELAAMFPEAGASPIYVREAFGVRAGFLVGWLRLVISVVSGAAVAIGFASYLEDLVGWPHEPTALVVMLICGAIVVVGLRETVTIAVAMTLLEAGGLILVIALGLGDIGSRSLLDAPHGTFGVIAGAALVFFAYEGFEQIATLSEETRDPSRTIPRAILLALGITAVLYILVALAAVSVLDWARLADSDSPLSEVARAASGQRAADLLSTIALFATFNTVLLLLATAARRAYGMAGRHMLPPVFRTVDPRRKTPWLAALTVTLLAGALTLAGDIRFVAQASNATVFVAYSFVNATVLQLRRARPDADRPFRIRGNWRGMPVTAFAGLIGALGFSLTTDLEPALLVAGIALLGLLLSPFSVRAERRARAAAAPER